MPFYRVAYQIGTETGRVGVYAESEEEALRKAMAVTRRDAPLPIMRYESFTIVKEGDSHGR